MVHSATQGRGPERRASFDGHGRPTRGPTRCGRGAIARDEHGQDGVPERGGARAATPLSVILGYGSLLAQGGLSAEHQKLAGARIYEKARQLSRLIMDMSLVGRLDELGSAMAKEELDLVELLLGHRRS